MDVRIPLIGAPVSPSPVERTSVKNEQGWPVAAPHAPVPDVLWVKSAPKVTALAAEGNASAQAAISAASALLAWLM
jgi:hypothetical protein